MHMKNSVVIGMESVRNVLKVLCHVVAYEGGRTTSDGCNYVWAMFDSSSIHTTEVQSTLHAAKCVTIFMDGECFDEDVTCHVASGELRRLGPPKSYNNITALMWHSSPFLQLSLRKVQVYLPDRGADYMHDIGCYLKRVLPDQTDIWLNQWPHDCPMRSADL